MPRPSKNTEIARKKILEALSEGCTRSAAAGAANVHVSQLTRWCESFASFASECAIAEQEAESRFTRIIYKAAQYGETKYALEWLKRRRRQDWGDIVTAEISGPGGGPIPIREIVIERPAERAEEET